MDRIGVFGSTGQLGSDLIAAIEHDGKFDVVPWSHGAVDCTDAEPVRAAVQHARPRAVVNCAAFVRVDDCEEHARPAFEVNALGALNVARACAEVDACCVYVSTDYVFDGAKESPYVESDAPNPINVYGTSKFAGELLVRQAAPKWLIVRLASLFGKSGARGKGGNFVETIIAKAKSGEPLRIVDDVKMSPTYTRDAAELLLKAVHANFTGILHLANDGDCSWFEFARKILEFTGIDADLQPVCSAEYKTKARRPRNSALASELVGKTLHLRSRPWQETLRAYLVEKGHISG